jgi:hypothetical protein
MQPYQLNSGTKYAIIVRLNGSAIDFLRWRQSLTNPYSNGNKISSSDSGGTWANHTGLDFMFKEYGYTTTVSQSLITLNPGTLYHYRAYAENNSVSALGQDKYLLTKPTAPTQTNSTYVNPTTINLSWTKGTGANRTIVVYKNTGFSTSITDGTTIYNNTDNYYLFTISTNTVYYLRAWSYTTWSGPTEYQFSDYYSDFETGGFYINCYDENNYSNLTFNVTISNLEGTDVYENTGCTNTHSINNSLCPHGDNIQIIISSADHEQRTYTRALYNYTYYTLDAYLPPTSAPPGGTEPVKSALYYLRVVETIDSSGYSYDKSVEDALVTVKKYINTSGIYVEVSSKYTDANGYIDIYLIYEPATNYKVFITKTGYDDAIEDYTPQPPNEWGQTTEKVFRLTKTAPTTPETPTTITFNDICTFNGTWVTTNNTLHIIFLDQLGETTNIQFYIYELFENNRTLMNTSDIYTGNISFYVEGLDVYRTHQITLFLNHSTLGFVKEYAIFVYGIHNTTINGTYIEEQLTEAFGDFDLGYINMFLIWGPGMIILLGLAAANHPGIGIIGSGLYIVVLTWKLETDIQVNLIILFGLLLLLGFIRLITKRRPDETGEG